MYFPVTQTFDFFKDPHRIIKFANSLEYKKSGNHYPGRRSVDIHEVNYPLFENINQKILSLFYPKKLAKYSYEAVANFQKINYDEAKFMGKTGWIHDDGGDTLTAIIYLTPEKSTQGTSIYTSKQPMNNYENPKIKYEYNQGLPVDENEYKIALNNHNNQFRKVSQFYSEFNSMICFDSNLFHGADFDLEPGEERLTYIVFFNKITASYFPRVECDVVL
jgi:hypothetical protein